MEIFGLTLITSSICNLNCSYCFLHKNEAYKQYDKQIAQAFDDGSYFDNISKVFKIMDWDPKKITQLSFWGGETLIYIKKITEHLPQLLTFFPNIDTILLSTNFSINIKEYVNFLIEINKLAVHPIEIKMQLSIDGPENTQMKLQGHNVSTDRYLSNIDILCNSLNNTYLNNITVFISMRATINKEVYFNELNTYEKIKDYLMATFEFMTQFKKKCISKSLVFAGLDFWPVLATPYYESTEDGRKLAQIDMLWNQVLNNEFKDFPLSRSISLVQGTGSYDKNCNLFKTNTECSELKHSITLNYDGTICECSGSYIDHFEPYQKELQTTKEDELYKVALTHSKMVNYNPIQHPEEIDKKKWFVHNGGYRNTKFTYLTSIILIAEELALSGQISPYYLYDKELLLRHSIMLLNNSCSRNNIAQTHSPYIKPIEELRRYFNGAMANIDKMNTITLLNQEGVKQLYEL